MVSLTRLGSLVHCPRNSARHVTRRGVNSVLPQPVQPAMTPALQSVLERPAAQRVPRSRPQPEPRFGQQWEPWFGGQWEPLFGRGSPRRMSWCRSSTPESACGCASNWVQPRSLGPSLQRYVVRKSNWFENQLNSAHPRTSLILTNERAAQSGDSFGDDPFATSFPPIVLTNSKPMRN